MIDETSSRGQGSGPSTTQPVPAQDGDPGLTGQVGQTARQAGEAVRREATGIAQQLMDQASRRVEAQRGRLAERVEGVAEIIEDAGRRIAEREPWLGRWIDQGVRGVHGLAGTMRERDPRDLLHVVTDFARRQPALFAGAAVAIGFAFARATRGSLEGAGHGRRERWEERGWRGRGDYERAGWQDRDWQDRDWQGPSPGHAHDEPADRYAEGRHGHAERGLGGGAGGSYAQAGRSGYAGSAAGTYAGAQAGAGGYGHGGGQDRGMSTGEALGGPQGGGFAAIPNTAAPGATGAHGGPEDEPGKPLEQAFDEAREAGEEGDETRLRSPEPAAPRDPSEAGTAGTASGGRTSPASGAGAKKEKGR